MEEESTYLEELSSKQVPDIMFLEYKVHLFP